MYSASIRPSNQLVHVGCVADAGQLRHDVGPQTLQETQALIANRGDVDLDACGVPLLHLTDHHAESIGVQTATQALVGRHDDQTHALDVFARDHERVFVFRMGVREVCRHAGDFLGVRARGSHPLLRFTHFGRRHHFHGFGDLARVFHALDLGPYLFSGCHCYSLKPAAPNQRDDQ